MMTFRLGSIWGANDVNKKPEPEPKGLEIITITPPLRMEVKYNDNFIGTITESDGSYKFSFLRAVSINDPTFNLCLDSELLKAIAAKLDELNGVYANNY